MTVPMPRPKTTLEKIMSRDDLVVPDNMPVCFNVSPFARNEHTEDQRVAETHYAIYFKDRFQRRYSLVWFRS